LFTGIEDYQTVNGSSFLQRIKLCLMSAAPSSERSLIKEIKLSSKFLFLRNGPYQYVALGLTVSILAHQANPSLFPKFLINLFGSVGHQFLLNSIQFCSENSIYIFINYRNILKQQYSRDHLKSFFEQIKLNTRQVKQ